MADKLDLDWFPFDLGDGQRLVLEVNWGEGGVGRAQAAFAVYDSAGGLIGQSLTDGSSWLGGSLSFAGDVLWVDIDNDEGFYGEYMWTMADDGALYLDEVPIPAEAAGAEGEAAAEEVGAGEMSGLFAGGDILFGGGIAIGDVLIGSAANDTYRITAESEGDTVTILDFHPGEGGDVLDISDLLANGSGTLEVSYDSRSASTTLTVGGTGGGDTVIVVYGVDLTSDFDAYVVTDTII